MIAYRRFVPILFILAACGPGDSGATDGSSGSGSGGTGSGTGDGTDATTSPTTGSASGSGGTGEECVAPEEYFVPGCGDVSPGDAVIEAGCHVPCDESNPCASGTCVTAWIDPCHGSPCGACGGQQGLCMESLPTGVDCESDDQCQSGVCWNYSDYDTCCFGAVCSGTCETNQDCVDLATAAGASFPESATCGQDLRCDLVSTGLGAFACAGPPCG